MEKREFTDLEDIRLVYRGNKILDDLFRKSVHSIRQVCSDDASAKGVYRFLLNDRVSEEDIVSNMATNCRNSCKGKLVLCIQDTSEINLSSHSKRLKKDNDIGTNYLHSGQGLGFFIHPSLVIDAETFIPYGFADVRVWNRPMEFQSKKDRSYNQLPIEQKESYKWIETSKNTQLALQDTVTGMIIVQDREGDIYEQFASIPNAQTSLLIRVSQNRLLTDGTKLFDSLLNCPVVDTYELPIEGKGERKKRTAILEVRYREVEIKSSKSGINPSLPASIRLNLIEVKEADYIGEDRIHWRLLTNIQVDSVEVANTCVQWYRCRWMIEEVFKILKKEGFNVEASELEYAASIRKLSLMILEVIIKLFLMRLAYAEPETPLSADSCFNEDEQTFLEHQITHLEGRTEKRKNPYKTKDLKRYVWAIARLGGWKGYESKRHPGMTTLWLGFKQFYASYQGWCIHRNVSTR